MSKLPPVDLLNRINRRLSTTQIVEALVGLDWRCPTDTPAGQVWDDVTGVAEWFVEDESFHDAVWDDLAAHGLDPIQGPVADPLGTVARYASALKFVGWVDRHLDLAESVITVAESLQHADVADEES